MKERGIDAPVTANAITANAKPTLSKSNTRNRITGQSEHAAGRRLRHRDNDGGAYGQQAAARRSSKSGSIIRRIEVKKIARSRG